MEKTYNLHNMENDHPKRKSTHLKYFDYSSKGAYFVTICTKDRKRLFSEIFLPSSRLFSYTNNPPVGEGLAPPAPFPTFIPDDAVAEIRLKSCGKIAEEQLLLLEKRYPSVSVLDYVIMPDHIHAIIFLNNGTSEEGNLPNTGGASPSPTSNDVENDLPCARGASPSPTSNDVENDLPCTGGASPSPTSNDVENDLPCAGGASPSPTSNDVENDLPCAGGESPSPTSNDVENDLPCAGGESPSPTSNDVENNLPCAGGESPSPTSNDVENNLPYAGGASPSPTSNDVENNLPYAGGASPSPTLSDIICSFKSLTARACKQKYGIEKLFQRSYAEHIIRDYKDYETRKAYIQQNPIRWYCKQLSQQDE